MTISILFHYVFRFDLVCAKVEKMMFKKILVYFVDPVA